MSAPPSLTPPPDPPAGPAAGHWDVAKWLIPSVGALFIIVGYVAKRAHYAYLGFSPGLLEPNQYIATAADFFRYLLRLPVGGVGAWRHALTDVAHLLSVVPALLLLAACLVWQWKARNFKPGTTDCRRRLDFFFLALIVVTILRLVALDAPVGKLEGSLIAVAEVTAAEDMPSAESRNLIEARLRIGQASDSSVEKWASSRALMLWAAVRCARHSAVLIAAPVGADTLCRDHSVTHAMVDGEGLAHLLMVLVIVVIAWLILRADSRRARVLVAWLSIFSCISMAATYGKLGHSLTYEFVEIALESSMDATDKSSDASKLLHGVVLHADGDWTTVARSQVRAGCFGHIEILRVSNSQILWQRDIFNTDLVFWSVAKTFDRCVSNKQKPRG